MLFFFESVFVSVLATPGTLLQFFNYVVDHLGYDGGLGFSLSRRYAGPLPFEYGDWRAASSLMNAHRIPRFLT